MPRKEPDGQLRRYECYQCGSRSTETDNRVCENCGGTLRNIGRARDL